MKRVKSKLISDLENCDIDFLVRQMMSNDIISPLLNQKRKAETSSTDEISWYAYRRAEKLNSKDDKEQLLKKLDVESDPLVKKEVYFCLSHLCKNTADKQLFNFLTDKLETVDKESKNSILMGLREMKKDLDLNIEPVKKLTKSKSWDVKINAIEALKYTEDKQVEDLLLMLFQDTNDSFTKGVICTSLSTLGTLKSVPVLQAALKKTRDVGLRYNLEDSIREIGVRANSSR